jgi:simple sugar transport system permease protein
MSGYIEIKRRQNIPNSLNIMLPILTILGALIVSSIPVMITGSNPILIYRTIFISQIMSISGIESVLVKFVPLLLAGLAVYLPYKAGLWNIGAEGQIYIGGIVGAWVALSTDVPLMIILPAMLVVGAVVGVLWGMIPAYLKLKLGIDEIITTLMMTFFTVQLAEYVVRGPLQGDFGFAASNAFPDAAEMPTLGTSRVHLGLVIALLACALIYVLMNKSYLGYEVAMVGSNPDATKYSKIKKSKVFYITMMIGGALAAIAGVIEVTAVYGRLQPNFSPGYGFTAIPIALLGKRGVVQVAGASLLFSVLFAGGTTAAALNGVSVAIIEVIQALVILFLLTAEFFRERRIKINIFSSLRGDN